MFSVITGDLEFHQILFVSASGFAAWKTLSLTMIVFAEERRNGTLGLLFLAGLSAWEVFQAKAVSKPYKVLFQAEKIEKARHTLGGKTTTYMKAIDGRLSDKTKGHNNDKGREGRILPT